MNSEHFSITSGEELERVQMSRQVARKTGAKTLSVSEQEATLSYLDDEQKTSKSNAYATVLKMSDFEDVVAADKIKRDERYVSNAERSFLEMDQDPERITDAKNFEKLFIRGVQLGRWLGNVTNTTEHPTFQTRTYETTPYDDILHRIDAFTTLKLAGPFETSIDTVVENLPLGFDVTTDGRRQTIEDKLTRHYNGSVELPFGFSQIDYYTDGTLKTSLAMVPRYIIGVSGDEVSGFSKQLKNGQAVNMLSPRNLRTRFKVLTEIRAQNELYEAMLPDNAYESEDQQIQRAISYIEAADDKLKTALQICTQEMIKQKVLPNEVIAKIQEKPNHQRQIIEEYLIDRGHGDYQERMRGLCRAQGKVYNATDDDADDVFTQIIRCTRQLSEAARQGKLDDYRKIMAHNKPIRVSE